MAPSRVSADLKIGLNTPTRWIPVLGGFRGPMADTASRLNGEVRCVCYWPVESTFEVDE
jgi:hypothetical protein